MNIKEMIFYLAGHEKELCMLGALTDDDKTWILEALGFDVTIPIENDDFAFLSMQDISEVVFDFIEHCEEVRGE